MGLATLNVNCDCIKIEVTWMCPICFRMTSGQPTVGINYTQTVN